VGAGKNGGRGKEWWVGAGNNNGIWPVRRTPGSPSTSVASNKKTGIWTRKLRVKFSGHCCCRDKAIRWIDAQHNSIHCKPGWQRQLAVHQMQPKGEPLGVHAVDEGLPGAGCVVAAHAWDIGYDESARSRNQG